MKKFFIFCAIMATMVSCSQKHIYTTSTGTSTSSTVSKTVENAPVNRVKLPATGGGPVSMLPNATAFRMSGEYADNVAITLGPDGEIIYFPDPSDITADSAPVSLGNGWWLNRQGIGQNSVFTKYTFAEYASLPEAPAPSLLLKEVLPGARVTEFIELPMSLNDAINNPQQAADYIKNL